METIKRRFGVLAGTAIGLLVGILILYAACDNEVPDDKGPYVTNKKPCSAYVLDDVGDGCPSAAYGISLVNKKCKGQEDSGTNCIEVITDCWGPVSCKKMYIVELKRYVCISSGDVNWEATGSTRISVPCPEGSGSGSW